MISPLCSGRAVCSPVRVSGFDPGVRFFHLDYRGCDGLDPRRVYVSLSRRLPKGTKLLVGSCQMDVNDVQYVSESVEWADCVIRDNDSPFLRLVWIDVLVDLGGVARNVSLDWSGAALAVRGFVPHIIQCSGGFTDWWHEQWSVPWGGPFAFVYDVQYTILERPGLKLYLGSRLLGEVQPSVS